MHEDTPSTGAIVLFSGGQDSTTCLYWALKAFKRVEALAFDYGQRHRVELEQAALIAQRAGVRLRIMNLQGLLSGSALTDTSLDVNAAHPLDSDLPAAFVPARNAVFLTVAAGVAFNAGMHDLVTGVCQTDYSGYPDCRQDFIDAQQQTLSLALDMPFRIHTPLMYLTKAETWKMARDLGCLEAVRELTHTDYNGDHTTWNEWGYGRLDNPASVLRARGYYEAKEKGWI